MEAGKFLGVGVLGDPRALPAGYSVRETGLIGFVDVLDHAGNVLARGVTRTEARQAVSSWQDGSVNPYLTALDQA